MIHIFRQQSSLGVKIRESRQLEFLSLHGQVCPLRVAPHRLCPARLSVRFRKDNTLGVHEGGDSTDFSSLVNGSKFSGFLYSWEGGSAHSFCLPEAKKGENRAC